MGERKRTVPKSHSPAARPRLPAPVVRWGAVALLAVAAVAGSSYALWHTVRTHVLASAEYRLSVEHVTLTPAPPWIRGDLRNEVLADLAFDGSVSILDDDLVERIAQAFALHPWVARVEHVRKFYPARVEVEVVYRQPVLLVETPANWLPVDAEAVLLPSVDFSPRDLDRYPRLTGARTAPLGAAGTAWGDPLVADAARIAELLDEPWQELHLAELRPFQVPVGVPHSTDLHDTFELLTAGQTRIIWGHAPGGTALGEPSAKEKLARLRAIVAERGSLDGPPGGVEIDLRSGTASADEPRTAARP